MLRKSPRDIPRVSSVRLTLTLSGGIRAEREGRAPLWKIRTHGETYAQVKLLFFQDIARLLLVDSGTLIISMQTRKIVSLTFPL